MRRFTADERRRRLASRQFHSLADAAPQATAELVGLHATDPATPFLSLWARCPGFVAADLEGELTSWLDGVRIKPRFSSPLSKAAG